MAHLNDLTLDPFPTGACWRISCSSLAGEGMNPISQFSFTFRPIHQLPSYFSNMWRNSPILKLKIGRSGLLRKSENSPNSTAVDRRVVIQSPVIHHVSSHTEGHRLAVGLLYGHYGLLFTVLSGLTPGWCVGGLCDGKGGAGVVGELLAVGGVPTVPPLLLTKLVVPIVWIITGEENFSLILVRHTIIPVMYSYWCEN